MSFECQTPSARASDEANIISTPAVTATSQPSGPGRLRPSIYDVALRAGVSHQTVSRVVNNHLNIRESTRSRVLQAIEEMNYTPNYIARALATRRARRIGVLIDDPQQNGPNNTLRALEKAARGTGYAVSAVSIGEEDSSTMRSDAVELVTQGVEALCVIAPRSSTLDLLHRQTIGLPIIVIKAGSDTMWHTVGIDQRHGARLAVQHMVTLGHRTIAHIAGPLDRFDARERTEGWRECLAEADLPEGPIFTGDWTSDSGFTFGHSFDLRDATAVFAANDRMALGFIHGLSGRGVRVPDDVSVAGFDDTADASHFLPPLTTVHQDFGELGELALQQIVAVIEGEAKPTCDMIQPRLIARESTRPPRLRL